MKGFYDRIMKTFIFQENCAKCSIHLESCQVAEMIGNDGIEMVIEDDIQRSDLHRVAIAFEEIVDAF